MCEVVDGDAAAAGCFVADGADLLHPLVGAVSGAEIHHGSPVVGQVFGERACGAGRERGTVFGWVHGGVQAVSPDELMEVRRPEYSGVDQATVS